MIFCGNKCDLEKERKVSKAEAQERANAWGIPFYETSALARINVEEAFFELVRQIRQHLPSLKTDRKSPKKKPCTLF
jgi:GTPase SAR1 family protein